MNSFLQHIDTYPQFPIKTDKPSLQYLAKGCFLLSFVISFYECIYSWILFNSLNLRLRMNLKLKMLQVHKCCILQNPWKAFLALESKEVHLILQSKKVFQGWTLMLPFIFTVLPPSYSNWELVLIWKISISCNDCRVYSWKDFHAKILNYIFDHPIKNPPQQLDFLICDQHENHLIVF